MPQGFYTAWGSVSFQWATSLRLGDTLTMEPSSDQFVLETRGSILGRGASQERTPLSTQ